jgi:cytochrome c2
MKKFIKYVLILAGVVVSAVAAFALYIYSSDFPSYSVQIPKVHIEYTPTRVERGKKLASMLCVECHQNPENKQITGRIMFDLPPEFGTAYTKNITQHPTKGIGAWSDDEIVYLLRTGIHPKTGRALPPYMIKLPMMADEDLFSIISWLRSTDPMVQPLDVDNKVSSPSFLTKFLMRVVIKPFEYPTKPIILPDSTNKVALGKYLVSNLGCNDCHAADVTKVNALEIEKTAGFMGGGSNWTDVNRKVLYASNITFDKETGIGSWSEADFHKALRDGIRPDGKPLSYPMERKVQLTDNEISSIYEYLKTVPHIHNPHKAPEEYTLPADATAGMKVYYKYGCQRCHGESGLGIGDLRRAYTKYPDDATLTDVIKHPNKYFPTTVMIQWDGIIKEEEFAPLCSHVRELGRRASAGASQHVSR